MQTVVDDVIVKLCMMVQLFWVLLFCIISLILTSACFKVVLIIASSTRETYQLSFFLKLLSGQFQILCDTITQTDSSFFVVVLWQVWECFNYTHVASYWWGPHLLNIVVLAMADGLFSLCGSEHLDSQVLDPPPPSPPYLSPYHIKAP